MIIRGIAFFLSLSSICAAPVLPMYISREEYLTRDISPKDEDASHNTILSKRNSSLQLNSSTLLQLTGRQWIIDDCGQGSKAEAEIGFAVFAVKGYQQAARQDAFALGTDSLHGFKSIFKSEEARTTVLKILGYMINRKGLAGLKPEPDLRSPPRCACVHPISAQKYASLGYDPWNCQTSFDYVGNPIPSFYALGTAYIFICPAFHSLEGYPNHSQKPRCPMVNQNRFIGNPQTTYQDYQSYRLIYEQVRFYLGDNALDSESTPREEFDWNNIIQNLDMIESLINPTSLELYIACKASFVRYWALS